MRLGNYAALKAALATVFGQECYTDDNSIVLLDGDQSTAGWLSPSREGHLWVVFPPDTGKQPVEIAVPGSGFEDHELGAGEQRQ